MIAYLRNRRIMQLTVLRAAIIAGTEWDKQNPRGIFTEEERQQAKRAHVLLAKTDAELEFLTKQ